MEQLLKNAFRTQIESKEGFDFEDFVNELCLIKYGPDGFLPIRRQGDAGNDGTIVSETKILACYAPKKYLKREFEEKVLGKGKELGDFKKYLNNWKDKYPNWEMLVNHELSPDEVKLIDDLDGNTSIKGLTQIISIIENEFTSSQLRKIAKYLNIDGFVQQDYIREILNDLLNPLAQDETITYKHATYVPLKIEINYDSEDVDGAQSEFYEISQNFTSIENILFGYEDDEKNKIKWRVIYDYNNLSGDFKTRLNNLCLQYTEKYGNVEDDDYKYYVKTILLYMFEQCLIGKKTEEEK